jgi:hypothetical protein
MAQQSYTLPLATREEVRKSKQVAGSTFFAVQDLEGWRWARSELPNAGSSEVVSCGFWLLGLRKERSSVRSWVVKHGLDWSREGAFADWTFSLLAIMVAEVEHWIGSRST